MSEKFYNGNCYEIIPNLPDCSIDLVVTDPPYRITNIEGGGVVDKSVKCLKQLESLDSLEFEPEGFLNALRPKMKRFYGYFFCNRFLIKEYLQWADNNKMHFDIFTLLKSNPIPAWKNHHMNDTEWCILIREKGTYFNIEQDFDSYRKFFTQICKKHIHPAEKPVEYLERFIKVSCPENGVVLDPFMGSGSTGVASARLGRNFIGIEKDKGYFDIARKRVDKIHNPPQLCFDF